MEEIWTFVQENVLPHWPFVSFWLIISIIAQILKTQVLTKDIAAKNKVVFWLRRTFPLILLALGVVAGIIWPGEASPGVSATSHKIMYFTASSAAAIVGFNAFKQWVKRKYDVDIGVPGSSTMPPKP